MKVWQILTSSTQIARVFLQLHSESTYVLAFNWYFCLTAGAGMLYTMEQSSPFLDEVNNDLGKILTSLQKRI